MPDDSLMGKMKDFLMGAGTLRKASGEANSMPKPPSDPEPENTNYVRDQIMRTKFENKAQGAPARSLNTTSKAGPTKTPVVAKGKNAVPAPSPNQILAAPPVKGKK